MSTRIWLRVDGDADDEQLEQETLGLRAELLALDIRVERPPAGAAPPGAKAGEWAAVGTLLLTLAGSPVLAAVIGAVSAWLERRGRRAHLEIDGDTLELPTQRAGAETWIRRHTAARHALIVANTEYSDPSLSRLRAPAADAKALATVLGDPRIGGFAVRTLMDQPAATINEAVEDFFADRDPDDLLLLHFSGHGVKDDSGELYFAAAGTKLTRLGGTAVAADFVTRLMNRSRSRRIVLLLDCCYSGAFARGMVARAGATLALDEQFGGTGRAVITASSAMEYAFEGQELADTRDIGPSVFTSALVQALDTGDADVDQDGFVGLDELYEYVYDRVRRVTPNQTPGKWVLDLRGDLRIARRARPVTVPAPLPPELAEAIAHPLSGMRAGAVGELSRLLSARHAGLALAARQALERLTDDDSRTVAAEAARALGIPEQPVEVQPPEEPPPVEQEPVVPAPRSEPPASPPPSIEPVSGPIPSGEQTRETAWTVAGRLAAGVGALLLVLDGAFASQLLASSDWQYFYTLALFEPVALWTLIGAALVLTTAPLGGRHRDLARGVLFGLTAWLLGLLIVLGEVEHTSVLSFGSWLTALAVLLVLAAAVIDGRPVVPANRRWHADGRWTLVFSITTTVLLMVTAVTAQTVDGGALFPALLAVPLMTAALGEHRPAPLAAARLTLTLGLLVTVPAWLHEIEPDFIPVITLVLTTAAGTSLAALYSAQRVAKRLPVASGG